jgi:hypothetical protein
VGTPFQLLTTELEAIMRKLAIAAITSLCALTIVGCSGSTSIGASSDATQGTGNESSAAATAAPSEPVTINTSPDKYTWYIKNYVGMNAAAVGYTALNGSRRDSYGGGTVRVVLVSPDGTYIDPEDEDLLKGYYVVAQSYPPNTELKYTFETDSKGNEYDNLTSWQNIDEVVLSVNSVGDKSGTAIDMTAIQASPDKYNFYVRDYVGRNLAECGYISLANKLTDAYGSAYITFDITADDGAYIELPDSSDENADKEDVNFLSQYVVTAQSVAPNTQVTATYLTDSNGNEYSNLIDTQSVESIALTVTKIPE